jgi:hypothetical protein
MKQCRTFPIIILLFCGLFLLGAQEATARTYGDVSFPDEATIGEKQCKLVGIGVREKFTVDVYYGALYLQDASKDREQIIDSEQPKRVLLHVVYKQVDADKWVEGWQEGFSRNVSSPDAALKQKMDQFMKCFSEPVKKGEQVQIDYVPGVGTEVNIKGRRMAVIPGRDFMTALWSIWFGKQPASTSLMKGMMGQ